MATYLLKASEEAMGRWRASAVAEEMTFADWLRTAADERSASNGHGRSDDTQLETASRTQADRGAVTLPGASAPTARAKKRTSMCVHRRQPDVFCKMCDA